MTRRATIAGLTLVLLLTASLTGWAQEESPEVEETDTPSLEDGGEVDPGGEEPPNDIDELDDEEGAGEKPPSEATPVPAEAPSMARPAERSESFDDFEDFEDLGNEDFVPLEDLDDADLDRITAMARFPHVELGGMLRVRSRARVGFDLGTAGTSAILEPIDRYTGINPDAQVLWTTDLRLSLAPTIHITETLRLHTDLDFLRNSAFGDDARHSLFVAGMPSAGRRVMGLSPDLPNPVDVRQAYGEVDTFFGTIQAGRMLSHWGLGLFANDGNCADCDFGDQVDRLALKTRLFDFYGMAALDFPAVGYATERPGLYQGAPQDLTRLGATTQWTASIYRAPETREDRERQAHRLFVEERAVLNGGLYVSGRSQEGSYQGEEEFDVDNPGSLIYRGLSTYTIAPWVQFLFRPADDQQIRIEVEGLTTLGRVDNASNTPVGYDETSGMPREDLNCFDEDQRESNPGACSTNAAGESTERAIQQFGLALESDIELGGPISFGLNAGFATGGDAPNWGYRAENGDQVDFTRFNPDYHVDLILFREVIGTVTNAYYANPYLLAKFLDTGLQRMEFQLDAIGSRAFNPAGAPGDSPWLGLEFDGSLRFIATDAFLATLDAGILFPLDGMGAVAGQERLNHYGALGPFVEDLAPSLAWTVQSRLIWNF